MYYNDQIWMASVGDDFPIYLNPAMANRHGLITGASGTGKTTTLKVMAESFSAMGVPVFLADIKGDLSGICMPGEAVERIEKRCRKLGVPEEDWQYCGFPTRYWDVFGEKGHPVRATITDMGPAHLARLLGLSEVQEGVLNLVFHIADEMGLLLLDLKDLRSMLSYCAEHRADFTTDYGNMSAQSIGAIQRALLVLEKQGGEAFFGEPALNIDDWIMVDENEMGFINVLCADRLVQNPLLYSTFLLWMLTELYERLPEEGDLDQPKMVFFFDEAHLLFNDAPKALLDKVTQIVKLIRSKGIGIYFISQSPGDIPDSVQGQLQNRIQHALHAYTPAELKAVRTAAKTLRPNPDLDTEAEICNLGVGEALVSFLDEDGVPQIVQKAKILPPQSYTAPAPNSVVEKIIAESEMEEVYREVLDRESAYELLVGIQEEEEERLAIEEERKALEKEAAKLEKERARMEAQEARRRAQEEARLERERRKYELQMLREIGKLATGTGRRTSSPRKSSSTAKRRTGSSYGYGTSSRPQTARRPEYDYSPYTTTGKRPTPPPIPPGDPIGEIGHTIGQSIRRGLFGNRRY